MFDGNRIGRKFDATMIEKKVCSVITPVSMDHMNFLVTTITKITREKIGILKNSENVIISKQKTSVRRIIRSEIKKKKIKLFEEGINWKILEKNSKEKKFSLKFGEDQYEFSYPSLFGEHQIDNASTAIATVLSLKNKKIKTNIINNGLLKVNWPARMQKLDKENFKFTGSGLKSVTVDILRPRVLSKDFFWGQRKYFCTLGMTL